MNSLLVPVIAVLLAWAQLNEIPSIAETMGMLMIATALMIIGVHGMRRKGVAEPATGQD